MHSVKLALDWSPNTLHAGFFYALLKGWYLDAGIQLDLINPEENDYVLTPAKQVANGTAHFGIAPTESVLSYQTLSTPYSAGRGSNTFTGRYQCNCYFSRKQFNRTEAFGR